MLVDEMFSLMHVSTALFSSLLVSCHLWRLTNINVQMLEVFIL